MKSLKKQIPVQSASDCTVAETVFFHFDYDCELFSYYYCECSPMMHKFCVFPAGDRVHILFYNNIY